MPEDAIDDTGTDGGAPDGGESTPVTDPTAGASPSTASPAGASGANPPAPDASAPKHPGYGKEPTPYEKQLRDEVVSTRQRYQRADQVLGQLPPEQQEGLVELAHLLVTDPEGARELLLDLVDPEDIDDGDDADDPRNAPVTRAELMEWHRQQQQAQQESQAVSGLRAEAQQAGIDPNSPEYQKLVATLAQMDAAGEDITAPDAVQKAVAKMLAPLEELQQSTIKDYIAGKTRGVAPVTDGGEASDEANLETFDDAKRAAGAFVRSGR